MKRFLLILCFFGLLLPLGLLSCGEDDEEVLFEPSVGIFLSPSSVDVKAGATLQLQAKLQNASGSLVWSVDGGSSYGTVTADGLYTAPAVLPTDPQAVVRVKLEAIPVIQATSLLNLVP